MNSDAKIILTEVCNALGIKEEKVLKFSRKRENVDARYIAVYFIRKNLKGHDLKTIGSWFSRRYESANSFVVHATKQAIYLNEYNKEFREKFKKCETALDYQVVSIYNHIPQY